MPYARIRQAVEGLLTGEGSIEDRTREVWSIFAILKSEIMSSKNIPSDWKDEFARLCDEMLRPTAENVRKLSLRLFELFLFIHQENKDHWVEHPRL